MSLLNRILAIYALFLIIFGTVGNLFSFIICLRKKLRILPTYVFLAFILICDTVALYFWNLNHFVAVFFGYVIDGINVELCRLFIFFQLFSTQASAWLLVVMSIERYLSFKIENWRLIYFSSKKAAITATVILILGFLFNINLVWTIDYVETFNETGLYVGCYDNHMHKVWQYVHVYVYSLIPFCFLAGSNLLFLYQMLLSFRKVSPLISRKTDAKRKSLSKTVSVMTISFILLTLPSAIAGGYYLDHLLSSDHGYTILLICDSFTYSYHAFNFIVFLVINRKFTYEAKMFMKNLALKFI